MKTAGCVIALVIVGGALVAAGQEDRMETELVVEPRKHSAFIGLNGGPAQIQTSGKARKVDGIDFTFDTDENDMATTFYGGYWITDNNPVNVGLEIGIHQYGSVKVPFEYYDPHDGTRGTGESDVTITGIGYGLIMGSDVIDGLQIVGRAGFLSWDQDFKSRFDIPGEPAIYANMSDSGTGLVVGLGLIYRFSPGWHIDARYEMATLDDDSVSTVGLGLQYDFIGLAR